MTSVQDVKYTKAKTYTFRLYVLLVDVGCPVFRNLVTRLISPKTFEEKLNAVEPTLRGLRDDKKIHEEDFKALYPGGIPIASTDSFDLSLLTTILRNVCGLQWFPESSANPNWNSVSLIKKITRTRNALFHDYDTEFCRPSSKTEEEIFQHHWNRIKQALRDLDEGRTTRLEEVIEKLKIDPLDPSKEKEFNKERAKWLEQANSLCNIYSLAELKEDDLENDVFVQTELFRKAKEKLRTNKIVILRGNPGEGKSITARMLAREVDNEKKWLNINSHTDWRSVSIKEHNVVIDDIFGASVLDVEELKKWRKYVKEVEVAVTSGQMYAIISSRNYILNEALRNISCRTIFEEENMIQLSSENLSINEKTEILKKHQQKRAKKKRLSSNEIKECVQFSFNKESKNMFQIGFPECVRLFCLSDKLFKEKRNFFERPLCFLKNLMRAIFEQDENIFLTYFLIWSQNKQIVSVKDTEQSIQSTPAHILEPIEKLQFDPRESLRKISRTLECNKDGFLFFDSNNGEYKFSHAVIADIVGLISFERNPTALLAYCAYDFTMRYIITQKREGDFIYIPSYRYDQFCARLSDYMEIREGLIDGTAITHSAFTDLVFCRNFTKYVKEKKKEELFSAPVQSVHGLFKSYSIEVHRNSHLPSFSLLKSSCESRFAMACFDDDLIPEEYFQDEIYLCSLITCRFGRLEILKKLFAKGAKVTDEMIIVAGNEGNDDVLEFLKQKCETGHEEESTGLKGKGSPLKKLIKNRSILAVEILLQRHKDYHSLKRKAIECTAMHYACVTNASNIAAMILTKYSDLDSEDSMGYYPIHIALENNHIETVKKLLDIDFENQASKQLTLRDKDGIKCASLLHIAVWLNNASLVDILTENDAFSSKLDGQHRTAFVFALHGKKYDCIKKLLDKEKIDKTTPDSEGNTPLHIAVMKTGDDDIYEECVNTLSKSVDVNIQNDDGNTPLHLAYYYRKTGSLKILLETRGIRYDLKNRNDKTPEQLSEPYTQKNTLKNYNSGKNKKKR